MEVLTSDEASGAPGAGDPRDEVDGRPFDELFPQRAESR